MNKGLEITKKILRQETDICEIRYEIRNNTDEAIYLEELEMFRADSLEELGVAAKNCKFFRSGRHKNDMPAVATFGKFDECMLDALGGMSETGDKTDVDAGKRTIISDHLTILGEETSGYCVISFLTGRDQLFQTEITIDKVGNFVSLVSKVIFKIKVLPGAVLQSEILRVEHTKDINKSIERFTEYKSKLYGSRTERHPAVFCTWYYYGLTVTYQDVLTNLERMEQWKLPFDVFQVDEGWEKTLGEWEPNEKFPVPMKEVAERIRKAGYEPGIWTSPFVAKETASIWETHPEWILREKSGEPCIFPMNDTTYYVFDITHPGTWEYFTDLYRKLTFEWGYTYHKLDFTRAAVIYEDAVFFDDTITMAQAYYKAVSAIRKGMGEEAYFLMCGGLYDPIIGLVDAQRTGSDVLSMWSSTINKGGKTAPYTIKQSLLRYYMNAWWNNDPDALMVRKNETMERNLRLTYGLLNDEEVKTSTINQFIGGGIVCSTEPLDKISDDRLYQLRHILPVLKTKVQPLDYMSGSRFPAWVAVDVEKTGARYIAVINWSDEEEMPVAFALDEQILGFESGKTASDCRYAVCDFYSGEYVVDAKAGNEIKFEALKPHAATIIKIEELKGQPVVVASDNHYSMGGELDGLELEDNCLIFSYHHKFDWAVTYQVFVPAECGKDDKVVTIHVDKKEYVCRCIP